MMEELLIVTTGGTIDKIYFDDKSDYQIGDPQIGMILRELGVTFRFNVIPILRKDSLHITDEDRELIRATIAAQPTRHVLVTHGTDSMVATGKVLKTIPGKTFTGRVSKINAEATTNQLGQHIYPVEVQVDNADGLLRPGMSGFARISFGRQKIGAIIADKVWQALRPELWLF